MVHCLLKEIDMQIMEPVTEIPKPGTKGNNRSKYQDILDAVMRLDKGLWFVIECDDHGEACRLFTSMRARGFRIKRRVNTLYLQEREQQ